MRCGLRRRRFLRRLLQKILTGEFDHVLFICRYQALILESNFANPDRIHGFRQVVLAPILCRESATRASFPTVSLPQRNRSLACSVPTVFRRGLREGQFSGDGVEC